MSKFKISEELDTLRTRVLTAIQPICPANNNTAAPQNLLFIAERTNAGRKLPPYYLVYFLFVQLLKFKNLGQWEKIAWSIPIDFKGKAFLIEHRKFGLGIFVENAKANEHDAEQIAILIKDGVKLAEPYSEYLANDAVKRSALNVINKGRNLFERYEYFLSLYNEKALECEKRKDEAHKEKIGSATSFYLPSYDLRRNADWLALATIDAFFSWTEHVFILLAILKNNISTALEIADLADEEWSIKFKKALNMGEPKTKEFYDQLILIRRQLRNYIAHGAFGKQGEAFYFHSATGAVPLLLPHQGGKSRFTLSEDLGFEESKVIEVIKSFIEHFWSDDREPAKLYIQESDLPIILPNAVDGTYDKAMESVEDMRDLILKTTHAFDRAANMDW